MDFGERLWWLLVAHALTDYVLQPEVMAKQKDPLARRVEKVGPWWWMMGAHALVNGGGVALVTGQLLLGTAEALLHGGVDTIKCLMCSGGMEDVETVRLWTWIDQGVHVASKLLWALLA